MTNPCFWPLPELHNIIFYFLRVPVFWISVERERISRTNIDDLPAFPWRRTAIIWNITHSIYCIWAIIWFPDNFWILLMVSGYSWRPLRDSSRKEFQVVRRPDYCPVYMTLKKNKRRQIREPVKKCGKFHTRVWLPPLGAKVWKIFNFFFDGFPIKTALTYP